MIVSMINGDSWTPRPRSNEVKRFTVAKTLCKICKWSKRNKMNITIYYFLTRKLLLNSCLHFLTLVDENGCNCWTVFKVCHILYLLNLMNEGSNFVSVVSIGTENWIITSASCASFTKKPEIILGEHNLNRNEGYEQM